MSSEENQTVIQKYIDEFWSQGKVELANELISPEFSRTDPSTPWVSGDREGIKQLMLAFKASFPDLNFTSKEVIPNTDTVVVHWTATGTHQGELLGIGPTGKIINIMGTSIYHLADGQMIGETTIWDALGMMQQLGVIPALA